jgi:hypothetical protein
VPGRRLIRSRPYLLCGVSGREPLIAFCPDRPDPPFTDTITHNLPHSGTALAPSGWPEWPESGHSGASDPGQRSGKERPSIGQGEHGTARAHRTRPDSWHTTRTFWKQRLSGFPLLALDGPIRRNAKKLGLSLVELDL